MASIIFGLTGSREASWVGALERRKTRPSGQTSCAQLIIFGGEARSVDLFSLAGVVLV